MDKTEFRRFLWQLAVDKLWSGVSHGSGDGFKVVKRALPAELSQAMACPVLFWRRSNNMVGAMFKSLCFAASAAFVVMADTAIAQNYVLVSCYRGPWNEVIWDRANPEFIQSLQHAGYSAYEAESIANYICRDPRLVNNPIAMAKEVQAVMRGAPRG